MMFVCVLAMAAGYYLGDLLYALDPCDPLGPGAYRAMRPGTVMNPWDDQVKPPPPPPPPPVRKGA